MQMLTTAGVSQFGAASFPQQKASDLFGANKREREKLMKDDKLNDPRRHNTLLCPPLMPPFVLRP